MSDFFQTDLDRMEREQARKRMQELLAQDSRVIREARMLPATGALRSEQIVYARELLGGYLEEKKISITTAAREMRRAASSLSQFLSGSYQGDNEKIARLAVTFVEQHARGDRGGPTGYVSTRVVENCRALMLDVQARRTIGLIMGSTGFGKSLICKAAESGLIPGSVYVEVMHGTRSPLKFAKQWARRLGLQDWGGLDVVEERIIEHLLGTRNLQLIDEAHKLMIQSLEVIRDVQKAANVPIVLVGTIDIEKLVDDARLFYGQMSRLVTRRYIIDEEQLNGGEPIYTVDEVMRYAEFLGLRLTGDGAETAQEFCCIPGEGGFARLRDLLTDASMLAEADGSKLITAAHLRAAIRAGNSLTNLRRYESRRADTRRKTAVA